MCSWGSCQVKPVGVVAVPNEKVSPSPSDVAAATAVKLDLKMPRLRRRVGIWNVVRSYAFLKCRYRTRRTMGYPFPLIVTVPAPLQKALDIAMDYLEHTGQAFPLARTE